MDIQPKAKTTKIKDAKSQGVSRKFDFLETLKYVLRRHLGLAGIVAGDHFQLDELCQPQHHTGHDGTSGGAGDEQYCLSHS